MYDQDSNEASLDVLNHFYHFLQPDSIHYSDPPITSRGASLYGVNNHNILILKVCVQLSFGGCRLTDLTGNVT